MPPFTDHKQCPHIKYWVCDDYTKRKNKAAPSARGRHSNDKNVAQLYIEDMNREQVSRTDVGGTHMVLQSLFESLLKQGEAAPSLGKLTYEARAYLHTALMAR
jgi:hypothetical protein